jgi:hypothetical protein
MMSDQIGELHLVIVVAFAQPTTAFVTFRAARA